MDFNEEPVVIAARRLVQLADDPHPGLHTWKFQATKAWHEAVDVAVSEDQKHRNGFTPRSTRACELLVAAYEASDAASGGSIEWSDVDDAHEVAVEALKAIKDGTGASHLRCAEVLQALLVIVEAELQEDPEPDDLPSWQRAIKEGNEVLEELSIG